MDTPPLSELHKDILYMLNFSPCDRGTVYNTLVQWWDTSQWQDVEVDEDGVPKDDDFEPQQFPHTPSDVYDALYELEYWQLVEVNQDNGLWSLTEKGKDAKGVLW